MDLEVLQFHPSHKFYKYIQAKPTQVHESDKFEDLPARITFEITNSKQWVLAFYQFSGENSNRVAFRLKSDEDEIPNTLSTSSNDGFVNLFGWGVAEFEEGDHDIYLQSLSKSDIDVDPINNNWQALALSVVELPLSTKVH